MHLLLGNEEMKNDNNRDAIQLFQRARAQLRPYPTQALFVISLASDLAGYGNPSSLTFSDRYLDGNLITSTSQSNSVCVKPCIQRVAPRMQGNLFSSW